MSNAVDKAKNTAPAGIAGLAAGLRRTRQGLPSFGGKGFLKFGNDGNWEVGKERTNVNEDVLIVNVTSIKSGYVCWTDHPKEARKKNEKLGEEMTLITMPPIDPSNLPDLGWEWRQQMSFEARFRDGDQEECSFTTSSGGGLEAMDTVLDAIGERLDAGEVDFIYPVVQLDNDWYDHKTYGKTYKPILSIIGWADVNGEMDGAGGKKAVEKKDAAPADEPADEPQPEEQEEPAAEPEETSEAPVRRRRRR